MATTGNLIKIGDGTYAVARAFPARERTQRVIIRYDGLFVYALFDGMAWTLADASSPLPTPEQEIALRELIDASGTLGTTVVDVEPSGT